MNDDTEDVLETPRRFSVDNYAYAASPRLGPAGWARWAWRQVTSMRLALLMLLLLALAAIPGSLLPQRPQDAARTARFIADNPRWGPLADRLGLLDVFGSAWFTAIYLLLFISLVGCIVPRAVAHGRQARAAVAPAPRSLARYGPTDITTHMSPDDAAAAIAAWGRGSGVQRVWRYRHRVERRDGREGVEHAISLEQGSLREWGNLLFHVALVGMLAALVYGAAYTYRGQVVLIEGQTFTNAVVSYDSFQAGTFFDEASLDPFTMTLDDFEPVWDVAGTAQSFTAYVSVADQGEEQVQRTIEVNHPLEVDGGKIYLQGNGYAPVITVRDADGEVAFSGPVPFLPQDGVYTSNGVVKVPDVTSGPQVGLRATLYPTAAADAAGNVVSVNPELINPIILLTAFSGDLGLDDGIPQNVYRLDESNLTQVLGDDGEPLVIDLQPGQTITLPDNLGTVTWESTDRFVALDLRADPSLPWMLGTALASMLGICVSLFAPRRRLWFILREGGGQGAPTLVTAAFLAPSHDEAAARQLAEVLAAVGGTPAERPTAEPDPKEDR